MFSAISSVPEACVTKLDPSSELAEPAINMPTRRESYSTLLEAVVRSSDDAIITKDLSSVVTSWNPAATAMFGYEPEEMIGRSILTIIPGRLQHEELEVIRRLKAGEQIAHFETTRVTKFGEEIQVSLTISPLRNEHGEIVGASKIARNITHQSQLERARLYLAAIVESSEDAIIGKTLDGTITTWNNAATRLFGYTAEEMIGGSILTIIPEDLHPEEAGIISRLVAGERIEHFETARLTKSGERIDVSLTISPIRDHSGKVVGASKILRDISDRKRMEKSLLQAEKLAATGRMAASIAHEINNPLEGLLNLIYLARISADEPDEVRTLLETAEGELARVAHIARQTLGYYREHLSPVRVQLSELVHDVLRVYQPRFASANVRVHIRLPETPAVWLKRGEIMQVFSNLVANSIHAMPSGGELTLALSRQDIRDREFVVLDIRDTGTGIAAEHMKRVFEPFFTTRTSIGTGIGLWVARQFVEGHGGEIRCSSSTAAADHGTTMSICLPVDSPYEPIQ